MSTPLQPYQSQFIDFLLRSKALQFGSFVTKSGRETPYFVNTAKFNTGQMIDELGGYYATHIIESGLSQIEVVFGPAYKGIPLAVATAAALFRNHGKKVGFCFDRKEEKNHGDKGKFVGYPLVAGTQTVIVEDVITAGTTMREVLPVLQRDVQASVRAVIIAVDRQERGTQGISAAQEVEKTYGVSVKPIITIHHIVSHLSTTNSSGYTLDDALHGKIKSYVAEYGV